MAAPACSPCLGLQWRFRLELFRRWTTPCFQRAPELLWWPFTRKENQWDRSSCAQLETSLGGGTPAKASHSYTSANKGTSIYGRCWCRERTTFRDLLGQIVIYGAGDGSSPSEEEKTPRNERWWR